MYKSKHADLIKVGHYSKTNAWSRIAHRGFYSCITPVEIINKTSVDDLDLIYWFPSETYGRTSRLVFVSLTAEVFPSNHNTLWCGGASKDILPQRLQFAAQVARL